MITERKILEALDCVIDPNTGEKIAVIGTLSVTINKGDVGLILRVNTHGGLQWEQQLKRDCHHAIKSRLSGVTDVTMALIQDKSLQPPARADVPGVGKVIIVASGKGGVGKSTVSVQLALTLASNRYRVALVDADIYGPSVPQLLGTQFLAEVDDMGQIVPLEKHGVSSISIGNLIQDKTRAIAWRGPMVTKAINKLITGTKWCDIDYMIIDTPPGTGDVHISLTRSYAITGGVVVTTPHELSVAHAMKTCSMLRSMQVRLLGVVENMSYMLDQKTGQKVRVFGDGGGRAVAEENSIPLLGDVGIYPDLCLSSVDGHLGELKDTFSETYESIASKILHSINKST